MGRYRACRPALTFAAVVLAGLLVRGQGAAPTGFTLIAGLGLPAVDAGALVGEHRVSTAARESRGALTAAIAAERRGLGSGPAYAAGRVIVKFRAGAGVSVQSLRNLSPTSALSSRPANADFDIVGIDPGEDAEGVAALTKRGILAPDLTPIAAQRRFLQFYAASVQQRLALAPLRGIAAVDSPKSSP